MSEPDPGAGRVVISSLTGKPWGEDPDGSGGPRSAGGRPRTGAGAEGAQLLPDRAGEDRPDPGSDESNDRRLTQDVPPHWGG